MFNLIRRRRWTAATSFVIFFYNAMKVYDRIGYYGLMVLVFILPMVDLDIIGRLITPFMAIFRRC